MEGEGQARTIAKMELVSRASELMPQGSPAFTQVIHFPPIAGLIKSQGRAIVTAAVFVLVKDFCASVNVVRNMNEDQMIEAASFLVDECGNFRLEDYVMMFTLAKRGKLDINDGKGLMATVDIETISKILDAYWRQRDQAGKEAQEREVSDIDNMLAGRDLEFNPAIIDVMTAWRKDNEQKVKFMTNEEQAAREAIYREEKIKQQQRDISRLKAEKKGDDA